MYTVLVQSVGGNFGINGGLVFGLESHGNGTRILTGNGNPQLPAIVELTDSVPDMVVTPPELPEITIPEDFSI